jgi:DNA-directed RNA polymerase specialized sigma24 family protein
MTSRPSRSPSRPPSTGTPSPAETPLEAGFGPDSVAPQGTHKRFEQTDCGPALDWRRYLCGGGPHKVIARLAQGDPLGLRRVVGVRLARRALLLDADGVHLRTMTRIALAAHSYEGHPVFARWLEIQVDRAMQDVREEERHATEDPGSILVADDCPSHQPAVHKALGEPLGISPAASRRVCAAFNHLPYQERHTFWSLVLRGEELDHLAKGSGLSPSRVARRARRVLDHLLLVAQQHPLEPQP